MILGTKTGLFIFFLTYYLSFSLFFQANAYYVKQTLFTFLLYNYFMKSLFVNGTYGLMQGDVDAVNIAIVGFTVSSMFLLNSILGVLNGR